MKAVSGRDLAKVVEQKGWMLLRIQGSHHIYGKPGINIRLTIPIHGSKPLKTGTQRALMRLAGVTDSDL